MKLTISRLKTKDVVTSRGDARVHNFNAGGRWYSSFVGSWNESWQNGDEIEIDPSQIKSNEKNGKTYLNIAAPAGNKKRASMTNDERILKALTLIYRDVQEIKATLAVPEIRRRLTEQKP